MDPDLRLARAMHPWIVIWDNHDVDGTADVTYEGSVQAFREWVPMRASQTEDDRAYRRLSYGDLLDILILDVLLQHPLSQPLTLKKKYLNSYFEVDESQYIHFHQLILHA